MLLNYFRTLTNGKLILWCYLLWYCVIVAFYFDFSPRLWLNSVGISLVIGIALQLSVRRVASDPWQTRRLFIMPFCVSSFSSLIKNQGFWLILPPKFWQLACAMTVCVSFIVWVKYVQKGVRDAERYGPII